MADKHTHEWELFASTSEEEAANAPAPRVVHAMLPAGHPDGALPHDPENKAHIKALKDPSGHGTGGVEDFSQPPPRTAGDVYLCSCGEARHTAPGQSPEEVDA